VGLLTADGRGRRYSRLRGATEQLLRLAYAGGWPARVLTAQPITAVHHRLAILPPGCPPLRVAFASDLHIGPITPPSLLDDALKQLAAWAPDVLLLGGDYVYLEATPAVCDTLRAFVAAVPAPLKLAVLGNHDLWTWHPRLEATLAEAGASVLVNAGRRLPAPHDRVLIAGLDDPWTGAPAPARAFVDHREGDVPIALVHAPDAVPLLGRWAPALTICGHTHGGQIALPGGGMIVSPSPLSRTYPHGEFAAPWGGRVVVSRGVGMVEVPLRAFAPPDVRLLTLVSGEGLHGEGLRDALEVDRP